jgi:UDP-N-acetylglucosamine transferase subunit ALG13
MIFVTIGTNEARFERLTAAAQELARDEEVVLQHGHTPVPPGNATLREFMSFDELLDHVRGARVVVMHAGVGSIIAALSTGTRPIVVPRLHRYGEAVDDHQLDFGRRADAVGLVTLVEDPADLPAAVGSHAGASSVEIGAGNKLVAELRGYLAERVGPPQGDAPAPAARLARGA